MQNMEKDFHRNKCTRVRSGMLMLMLLNYCTGSSQLLIVKSEVFDFQTKNNYLSCSCSLGFTQTILQNFEGSVCYIFASLFLCLKESTCETYKNVFYLTSKALLFLEIIKLFRYSNVMTPTNA